jgi:hypothetical protein
LFLEPADRASIKRIDGFEAERLSLDVYILNHGALDRHEARIIA